MSNTQNAHIDSNHRDTWNQCGKGRSPPPPRTKNLTIITEKITNMAIGQSFDGCPSKVYWLYTHFVTMDHTGPQQQLLAFVVRAVSGPSSSVRDMERRGCPEHVSTCQNLFPKQRGSPFKPALFFFRSFVPFAYLPTYFEIITLFVCRANMRKLTLFLEQIVDGAYCICILKKCVCDHLTSWVEYGGEKV